MNPTNTPPTGTPTAAAAATVQLSLFGPESGVDLEALLAQTAQWRTVLRWREGRWLPDADAEIAASVWEQLVGGVREHRDLYIGASRHLQRIRRREQRARRTPPVMAVSPTATPDFAERLCDHLAAQESVARIALPAKAAAWIERQVSDTATMPLSDGQRLAGRRWANRARARLEYLDARDEVA